MGSYGRYEMIWSIAANYSKVCGKAIYVSGSSAHDLNECLLIAGNQYLIIPMATGFTHICANRTRKQIASIIPHLVDARIGPFARINAFARDAFPLPFPAIYFKYHAAHPAGIASRYIRIHFYCIFLFFWPDPP